MASLFLGRAAVNRNSLQSSSVEAYMCLNRFSSREYMCISACCTFVSSNGGAEQQRKDEQRGQEDGARQKVRKKGRSCCYPVQAAQV